MLDHPATQQIIGLLNKSDIQYQLLEHEPCRSSEESRKTRALAGGGDVIGAKAILMKMARRGGYRDFGVFVLPGDRKLDGKAIKKHLPDVKSVRFCTTEEMAEVTGGLAPGTMPPFGSSLFPYISILCIDENLFDHKRLGFNAARLDRSIVMETNDYLNVASPDSVFKFSNTA